MPVRPGARTAVVVVGILLVPLLATLLTDAVDWSVADFVVAAAILIAAATTTQLTARRFGSSHYAPYAIAAVGLVFVLIWLELAVGIFGTLPPI